MKRVMAVGIVNIDLIYTTPRLLSVEGRHYHGQLPSVPPSPSSNRMAKPRRRTQYQLWPTAPPWPMRDQRTWRRQTPRWSPSASRIPCTQTAPEPR